MPKKGHSGFFTRVTLICSDQKCGRSFVAKDSQGQSVLGGCGVRLVALGRDSQGKKVAKPTPQVCPHCQATWEFGTTKPNWVSKRVPFHESKRK